MSADDIAGLSIDILKTRAMQKRRDSAGAGRRGSESGPGKSFAILYSRINLSLSFDQFVMFP